MREDDAKGNKERQDADRRQFMEKNITTHSPHEDDREKQEATEGRQAKRQGPNNTTGKSRGKQSPKESQANTAEPTICATTKSRETNG